MWLASVRRTFRDWKAAYHFGGFPFACSPYRVDLILPLLKTPTYLPLLLPRCLLSRRTPFIGIFRRHSISPPAAFIGQHSTHSLGALSRSLARSTIVWSLSEETVTWELVAGCAFRSNNGAQFARLDRQLRGIK